ncbi:MAG: PAS domain-containing protein [Oligoflexia bacterium]|nr:PAS domain-containing protein [Oligoflexia bacterium]
MVITRSFSIEYRVTRQEQQMPELRINEENEKEAEFIHQHPDMVKSHWADFQYRIKHKEGHWVNLHTRGRAFSLDEEGKVKRILNFSFDADKNTSLDFKELGKVALHSFEHFTDVLTHDLKGHVHVLEFIVNELVQDSIDIENLSKAELKEKLVTNSIAISEVSTKLSNLFKNLK